MSSLRHLRLPIAAGLLSLSAALIFVSPALASCDDGTSGNDDIVCSTDPVVPDDVIGLDLGDDTYVQNAGVTSDLVGGDSLADGSQATGNGGNDTITINGTVTQCVDGDNVDGDGGSDTITINGEVGCSVNGDYVDGNGGNDTIEINGTVHSDVVGDDALDNGGNDTIIINGTVGGDVVGDYTSEDGGNDTIIINGTVEGDVYGDDVFGVGGDDTVILGEGAVVEGIIDGEDGFDTLAFDFLTQSQLDDLDPSSGSITIGGITYTWTNFEQLLGLLQRLARLWHSGALAAFAAPDGIKIVNGDKLIAFVPFSQLNDLHLGAAGLVFQGAAQSQGWYVTVSSLGVNVDNPTSQLFQVSVYNAAGSLTAQFTFSN